jgi:hypothetical protein
MVGTAVPGGIGWVPRAQGDSAETRVTHSRVLTVKYSAFALIKFVGVSAFVTQQHKWGIPVVGFLLLVHVAADAWFKLWWRVAAWRVRKAHAKRAKPGVVLVRGRIMPCRDESGAPQRVYHKIHAALGRLAYRSVVAETWRDFAIVDEDGNRYRVHAAGAQCMTRHGARRVCAERRTALEGKLQGALSSQDAHVRVYCEQMLVEGDTVEVLGHVGWIAECNAPPRLPRDVPLGPELRGPAGGGVLVFPAPDPCRTAGPQPKDGPSTVLSSRPNLQNLGIFALTLSAIAMALITLHVGHQRHWSTLANIDCWMVITALSLFALYAAREALPGANRLELRPDGFTFRRHYFSSWYHRWNDVDAFTVTQVNNVPVVTFRFAPNRLLRIADSQIGYEAGYGPQWMPADQLARLLERYRQGYSD